MHTSPDLQLRGSLNFSQTHLLDCLLAQGWDRIASAALSKPTAGSIFVRGGSCGVLVLVVVDAEAVGEIGKKVRVQQWYSWQLVSRRCHCRAGEQRGRARSSP